MVEFRGGSRQLSRRRGGRICCSGHGRNQVSRFWLQSLIMISVKSLFAKGVSAFKAGTYQDALQHFTEVRYSRELSWRSECKS